MSKLRRIWWYPPRMLLRFALAAFVASTTLACGAVEAPQPRVWSTANSNDGYATCPPNTTVTGGGFEMKTKAIAPGHVPTLIASHPDGNGWRVVCVDETGTNACRAWAVCASVLAR
jgi:hypothetical protein